jgi:hypothetical protein
MAVDPETCLSAGRIYPHIAVSGYSSDTLTGSGGVGHPSRQAAICACVEVDEAKCGSAAWFTEAAMGISLWSDHDQHDANGNESWVARLYGSDETSLLALIRR